MTMKTGNKVMICWTPPGEELPDMVYPTVLVVDKVEQEGVSGIPDFWNSYPSCHVVMTASAFIPGPGARLAYAYVVHERLIADGIKPSEADWALFFAADRIGATWLQAAA
jgi:hypothetical protein